MSLNIIFKLILKDLFKLTCTNIHTTSGIGVGIDGGISVSKYLSFTFKFLCAGQGAVRPAILNADSSYFA